MNIQQEIVFGWSTSSTIHLVFFYHQINRFFCNGISNLQYIILEGTLTTRFKKLSSISSSKYLEMNSDKHYNDLKNFQ